ncbi:MAG: GGDEF domain-containing protein [Butyrivibrio sp.]|nr:GGDEF domain-containing protein [Butyrivibrio sp.]
MRPKTANKRILMFPFLLAVVTVVMVIFGSNIFVEPAPSLSRLDEGWSVSYGGNEYSNVTLSELNLGRVKKGDIIILSNTIPAQRIYAPTIMFKNVLSTVDVIIDGRYAYTFGHIYDDEGKMVPKKIHLVTLDDMTSAHSIEIMLKVTEDRAFKYIFPIYCGTKRELIKNFLQRQRLSIFIGGFLIMYGSLQLALEVYLFLTHRQNSSLIFSAFISLVFGIYTYAYKDIFCIMSDRDYFFSQLEYVALILTPLSITLLLYSTYPSLAKIRLRIFLVINTIMPIVFFLLSVSNTIHFNHFVPVIQIVAFVENLIIIPPLLSGTVKAHNERVKSVTYTNIDADNYLLIGFVILIFFSLLEIIKFNFTVYISTSDGIYSSINLLTIGTLYFIICLFIYYFFNGIDHINTIFLKEHLEGLAYTDALTGLMNRAKCMQYLASVHGEYAVISLDLDKLKTINDTYGHSEGDKMIKAFADLLVKAFEKADIIGRTGGDEFLVAFENPSATICDESIDRLQRLMGDFNKEHRECFTLSASAGYAYSYEDKEGKFENVFYLADTRMYRMKEEHHV